MDQQEIDNLRQLKTSTDAVLADALREALNRRRLLRDSGPAHEQAQALLDAAEPHHLTHPQLRTIERRGLAIPRALSFRAIMMQRSEASRIGVRDPGWALDRKHVAYDFADRIGVRRPKSDLAVHSLDRLHEPDYPAVVKPVHATGGRGVYLCFSPTRIRHVGDRAEFDGWGAASRHARTLIESESRPVQDQWMTEELIPDDADTPARDVKFLAFYGEVALTMEIVRHPRYGLSWRDRDGNPVVTGRRDGRPLREPRGVTGDQLALAERISRQIPRPFMRIDMLRSGSGELVVGEFTPRPGQFDQFAPTVDRMLGEAWMRAEQRIADDLLAGARFDAFSVATSAEPHQFPPSGYAPVDT